MIHKRVLAEVARSSLTQRVEGGSFEELKDAKVRNLDSTRQWHGASRDS